MTSKSTIDLPIPHKADFRWIAQKIEGYFIKDDGWQQPRIMQARYETIAAILDNLGDIQFREEDGRPEWTARLLGGQDIGKAAEAAYFLAAASKGAVNFSANGVVFIIAENGTK